MTICAVVIQHVKVDRPITATIITSENTNGVGDIEHYLKLRADEFIRRTILDFVELNFDTTRWYIDIMDMSNNRRISTYEVVKLPPR